MNQSLIDAMNSCLDADKVPEAFKNDFWCVTQAELERFATIIRKQERERCAKVVESCTSLERAWYERGECVIAKAIRVMEDE